MYFITELLFSTLTDKQRPPFWEITTNEIYRPSDASKVENKIAFDFSKTAPCS